MRVTPVMVSIFAKCVTFATTNTRVMRVTPARTDTFAKCGASARGLVAATRATSAACVASARFGAAANVFTLVRAQSRVQSALALVRVVVFLALVGSA